MGEQMQQHVKKDCKKGTCRPDMRGYKPGARERSERIPPQNTKIPPRSSQRREERRIKRRPI
ncbi:hypothetical protein EMPG_14350 [Blastomyces silverae]|uniref:Uncharacterized protein n=1 Tax=Blastomyces silverae TaxID=2060906 RepID=A0A0H1BM81_9EURO|nr:hypothetical protein EMPG_14350 [Blastomyces silverae]